MNSGRPQLRLVAAALLLSGAASAQEIKFEHLFSLGSSQGINPPQALTGRFGKLVFGRPARMSPLVLPDSVAVDPDERIWITDRGAPAVHLFDLVQNRYQVVRGAPEKNFQCPAGIDTDLHGRVYVADSCLATIFVFDKDGSFLRFLPGGARDKPFARPVSVRVARDLKTIYVTDPPRHKVVVLNQEGEAVREWGDAGLLSEPAGLALGRKDVQVLDAERGVLQVFTPAGDYVKSMRWDPIRRPAAFAFDPERRRYFVADGRFELVMAFDENGGPLGAFGQSGSGQGEMHAPANLCVDAAGRIYVVDPQNAKVLVFR